MERMLHCPGLEPWKESRSPSVLAHSLSSKGRILPYFLGPTDFCKSGSYANPGLSNDLGDAIAV